MTFIDLFEALMILCFGISWPVSIYKSLKSKTAKGKSLYFEIFIFLGYVFGIIRKIIQLSQGGDFNWLFYLALIFYIINIVMVAIDILLYFRNSSLDKRNIDIYKEG